MSLQYSAYKSQSTLYYDKGMNSDYHWQTKSDGKNDLTQ